ncbi:hypothetical protein GCM10007977_077900 [Dactylosporangium sucinum]|uniref:Uncharacterized protein n=1 Tax=Dactylosporangium sucinum TaxID=1424081 RepID=A0A917U9L6_9ACTN|nr:hypothetical protein GCM10007977_077900 [Dactylosporangium sucinum]
MDVFLRVTDRDPSDGIGIVVRGDADGGHYLGGDVRSLGVGQSPVLRVVAHRGMPDRLLRRIPARPYRLFEQPGEWSDIMAIRRLQ